MSLTIKAYFEKAGSTEVEIRRFNISTDVSRSYDNLIKKVASIFPSLKEGEFSVSWKDSDGDLVLFSSDEELVEALGHVEDTLFKIFIRTKDSLAHGTSVALQRKVYGKVLQGILCNGCYRQMKGLRYKCMECADHNLCAVCERQGTHSEHRLLKVTQPNRAPFYVLPPHGRNGMMSPKITHYPGPRLDEDETKFTPPQHFFGWMRWWKRNWQSQKYMRCPMKQNSMYGELSLQDVQPPAYFFPSPRRQPPVLCEFSPRDRTASGICSSTKMAPNLDKFKDMKISRNAEVVIDLTAEVEQNVTMGMERLLVGQTDTRVECDTEEIRQATEKIILDDNK